MTSSQSVRIIASLFLPALLFAVVSLLPARSTPAQDLDNVTITGRVTDPNGAFIPGATIEAIFTRTGATRTTVSDDEGRYRIIQLEPGAYNLRASFAGFATLKKNNLIFLPGTTHRSTSSLLFKA